ncbi:hypothetical protein [Virgibacillus doumboii]|uniref:hypothetical protein n=1 Tax=Virgibacillus doumboii TaxID=2697503 RepID=UPI0013DECF7C|nr:hypothetical protein [Virgibacillus doumboii]
MKRLIAIIGFFVLVFTFLSFGYTYTAHADEQDRLEIKVEAGLDGKAKQQQGYPVTLTVTNNKENFNGDLVFTLPVGNKVIPIDIASGTTKTISFSLPAMEEMGRFRQGPYQNEQQFHLYEGDWKNGNEVSIDSSLEVTPAYIQPDKLVIGVLSDRPDSLNYLKLTSFYGNNPEVFTLEASDIPEDAEGLEVLDLLVINDYSVAKLPEEMQESIKNWVRNGGTLVTGSEPGLQKQFGTLADVLPLTITGTETVQKIQGFEKLYKEPIEANNLELFTGDIDKEATVLYKEDSIPLVVEKKFGRGSVNQVTFDLGLSALSNWKGNAPLWQSIGSDISSPNPGMNVVNMHMGDRLADLSRTFPTLANFKVSTLSLLFAAYLLVIIPVLYIVLKRMDKREWAWLVIPALAIVSSVGLYGVGAKDRGGSVKTNTVSVISVNEQGIGSGEGAISMLSKGSGSYTLSLDNKLDPLPAGRQYGPQPQQSHSDLPYVEAKGNESIVQFQHVEFWSPRSVAVDYPVKEYGQFASNLTLSNGEITGKITNSFDYDFQNIYLISGQNYHEFGELAAGESKEVSFNVRNKGFFQGEPTEQVAFKLFGHPGQMGQRNDEQLKSDLLAMAIRNHIDSNVNSPRLIGFTEGSLNPITVNGDETVQNNLHLFTQPATIQIPEGETSSVSSEIKLPKVSTVKGQIFHNGIGRGEPFIDAEAGTYLLTYELPESLSKQPFELAELGIRIKHRRNGAAFSLYNVKSDTYEPIEQNYATFNQKADENYLKDNAIVLRVSIAAQGPIDVPTVTAEGVINP